jgi:hypothetical protein
MLYAETVHIRYDCKDSTFELELMLDVGTGGVFLEFS